MSRYKNISQRAARYARGKGRFFHSVALAAERELREQGFRDGYRFAIKELRQLIDAQDSYSYDYNAVEKFAYDTERLK